MSHQRWWTDAENALMREHYRSGGTAQLRPLLNRTPQSINSQAAKLGLSVKAEVWSAEQDEAIRLHLPSKGAAAVSEMVGRTPGAVRARASRLNVRAEKRRREPKPQRKPNPILALRKPKPAAPRGMVGEPIITSKTRVTIAPAFVERFAQVGPVPRVVDSADCREWAKVA